MKDLSPHFIRRTVFSPGEDTAVFGEPIVLEDEEPRLYQCWRVIRKHSRLIAVFFFGTVLTTALVISMMTPIYTAKTMLLIERKSPRVVDIQQALSEPQGPEEDDYYKTQYEILKSRSLAARVIREQGLEKNGLFTGNGRKEGFVPRLWAKASALLKEQARTSRFSHFPPNGNGGNPLGIDPEVIDAYVEEMLEVEPIRRTRLLKIAISTPDPGLSARLANAHAEAYIRRGMILRTQASQGAQKFMEEKLVELKERVEKSDAALNRYRREKGILALGDKENIVVERLAHLNNRLTEAEVEKIALEAQVHLISTRDYNSLPAVIGSSLIQNLKEQLARLEGKYAHLSTRFKPGYPSMAQLKAQLEKTRGRLRQEIQRVVGGTKSAYLAAEAKVKKLAAKMEKQKAATLALKDASVQYAILTREVDTNRQLYDSVLQRIKEIGVAAGLSTSNIFVIDKAESPIKPSKPKKKLALLLSALLGLVGSVTLAFILEQMDNTLKTPEDAQRYLHVPSLGVVPDFLTLRHAPEKKALEAVRDRSNSRLRTPGREIVTLQHPLSEINEAYRNLRTAILLSQAGEPPKTILFTSGVEGEGKTVTVVNTAIIFAQMGGKVLVIDADLRNPSCHKVLGMKNWHGLTDVLTGHNKRVIERTAINKLFLLSSGSCPPNPAELVGSKKMNETLISLRERYDYILIDAPPVMPVSDAVLLSTMVDGAVLVVSGQTTPKHVAKAALSRLDYARSKVLGVLLNRVNMRNGDYAYNYHHYYSYYPQTEEEQIVQANTDHLKAVI